jgi:hypothetical protein
MSLVNIRANKPSNTRQDCFIGCIRRLPHGFQRDSGLFTTSDVLRVYTLEPVRYGDEFPYSHDISCETTWSDDGLPLHCDVRSFSYQPDNCFQSGCDLSDDEDSEEDEDEDNSDDDDDDDDDEEEEEEEERHVEDDDDDDDDVTGGTASQGNGPGSHSHKNCGNASYIYSLPVPGGDVRIRQCFVENACSSQAFKGLVVHADIAAPSVCRDLQQLRDMVAAVERMSYPVSFSSPVHVRHAQSFECFEFDDEDDVDGAQNSPLVDEDVSAVHETPAAAEDEEGGSWLDLCDDEYDEDVSCYIEYRPEDCSEESDEDDDDEDEDDEDEEEEEEDEGEEHDAHHSNSYCCQRGAEHAVDGDPSSSSPSEGFSDASGHDSDESPEFRPSHKDDVVVVYVDDPDDMEGGEMTMEALRKCLANAGLGDVRLIEQLSVYETDKESVIALEVRSSKSRT